MSGDGWWVGRDVLQAVSSRGGSEGGFGPSLNQGLGSSAWMPYRVGRYLLCRKGAKCMVLLVDVLSFRSVSGRLCPFRFERPPWISLADRTSP